MMVRRKVVHHEAATIAWMPIPNIIQYILKEINEALQVGSPIFISLDPSSTFWAPIDPCNDQTASVVAFIMADHPAAAPNHSLTIMSICVCKNYSRFVDVNHWSDGNVGNAKGEWKCPKDVSTDKDIKSKSIICSRRAYFSWKTNALFCSRYLALVIESWDRLLREREGQCKKRRTIRKRYAIKVILARSNKVYQKLTWNCPKVSYRCTILSNPVAAGYFLMNRTRRTRS